MTKQQALKIIHVNGYGYPEKEAVEAHRIIETEMGFRIERAPKIHNIDGFSVFGEALCPECGALVYRTEDYCTKCGQALDWIEFQPEQEAE